ncbi:MAG: hypothetical protein A2Y71_08095 [Bacteroidetes bacterium RBG_13_42_15]|nr:MAG: hypothetical protein A2Y71_08095 [Bacteroidetes bacterium RBG_13_42_15]
MSNLSLPRQGNKFEEEDFIKMVLFSTKTMKFLLRLKFYLFEVTLKKKIKTFIFKINHGLYSINFMN